MRRQIPDSKLMPRSIYDVRTQSTKVLQWSLCRAQRSETFLLSFFDKFKQHNLSEKYYCFW